MIKNECIINDDDYIIVTMGTFDGVHLGHKKLLTYLVERAKEKGGKSVVLTYYHHPLEVLKKITYPYLITEKGKKMSKMRELGIDCVVYLEFTYELSKMEPEDFIKDVLVERLKAKEIVFGYDTHFGEKRRGNYKLLKSLEDKYGYKAKIIEPLFYRNRLISSSRIRELIKNGEIKLANKLLGYKYSILGKVIPGRKIGRTLGFPTINLETKNSYKLVPDNGVYLSIVKVGDFYYSSITNVGVSPTLKSIDIPELETFLLDFSGDLYNEEIELLFLSKIRNEKKFISKELLIKQIKNDVNYANLIHRKLKECLKKY